MSPRPATCKFNFACTTARRAALEQLTDRLLAKEVIDSVELAEVLRQFPDSEITPSVN